MKKISIIVVLLLVFGIAGIFFFSSSPAEENTAVQQTENTTLTPSNNVQGKGTFKNLLGLGKNLKCTVSYNQVGAGLFEGTTYVSGTKMRADFTTSSGEESMQTSMITDGTQGYMWGGTSAGTMAMKFEVDPTTQEGTNQQFDMNADVDYTCEDWRVDGSLFVPPADLDFVDMTTMQKQMTNPSVTGPSTADYKGIQCNLCSEIQDESAKSECMQAFSC